MDLAVDGGIKLPLIILIIIIKNYYIILLRNNARVKSNVIFSYVGKSWNHT